MYKNCQQDKFAALVVFHKILLHRKHDNYNIISKL